MSRSVDVVKGMRGREEGRDSPRKFRIKNQASDEGDGRRGVVASVLSRS